MAQGNSLLQAVALLYRRRRLILTATGAAALLGVVLALLLPVYYRASTTFLAASADQLNPSKLFARDVPIEVYGDGNDIERLIAVASSSDMAEFLVDSFDLYRVYDIDPSAPRARYKVREELADLYHVTRSKYDEITIAVEDEDPRRAANMANAARQHLVRISRAVVGSGQRELTDLYDAAVLQRRADLQQNSNKLQDLTEQYGIVDATAQAEALALEAGTLDRAITRDSARIAEPKRGRKFRGLQDSLAIINAQLAGNRAARTALQKEIVRFAKGKNKVQTAEREVAMLTEQLVKEREKLLQYSGASEQGPVIHLIDRASVPDVKARPKRSIIVLAITAMVFLFTCLAVLVADSYKRIPWNDYLER